MPVLPDYLVPNLLVVFCGTAVAKASAKRRHYYAGNGNEFWPLLFQSGLLPVRLSPEDDTKVCTFGLGLTDLAKEISASSDSGLRSHYQNEEFIKKIERLEPSWVAFHGKEAANSVARHLDVPGETKLGKQTWKVGLSSVFVLPSASGANRDPGRLEGKASRLEWFEELAALVRSGGGRSAEHGQSTEASGDCFQAAFQHLMQLWDGTQHGPHTLVHAVVTHPNRGTFAHAWVEREKDNLVVDVSNGKHTETKISAFYELFRVREIRRYVANDAAIENLRSGHFGPWDMSFDKYDPKRVIRPS